MDDALMLPPLKPGARNVFLSSGRGYAALGGRTIGVDPADVDELIGEGWLAPNLDEMDSAPRGKSRADRPADPARGDLFQDRRFGGLVFDGNVWRSIRSGLAVQ